jgi:hypothetical protein
MERHLSRKSCICLDLIFCIFVFANDDDDDDDDHHHHYKEEDEWPGINLFFCTNKPAFNFLNLIITGEED